MRILGLLLCLACVPNIPQRTLAQRTTLPSGLPALAPCALVHLIVDEDLSNGARGWFRGDWKLAYTTFLIRHPKGVVLIDASFGDSTSADLEAAPWWFRFQFGGARAAKPIAALLSEAGVKPEEVKLVLITHAHWDHTGGLAQLPNARVAMAAAEADWILGNDLPAFAMPQHVVKVRERLERVQFDGPAVDGFAASHDVLSDRSIVAVPTPGHTARATSWFVNSGPDGELLRRFGSRADGGFAGLDSRGPRGARGDGGHLARRADVGWRPEVRYFHVSGCSAFQRIAVKMRVRPLG